MIVCTPQHFNSALPMVTQRKESLSLKMGHDLQTKICKYKLMCLVADMEIASEIHIELQYISLRLRRGGVNVCFICLFFQFYSWAIPWYLYFHFWISNWTWNGQIALRIEDSFNQRIALIAFQIGIALCKLGPGFGNVALWISTPVCPGHYSS